MFTIMSCRQRPALPLRKQGIHGLGVDVELGVDKYRGPDLASGHFLSGCSRGAFPSRKPAAEGWNTCQ